MARKVEELEETKVKVWRKRRKGGFNNTRPSDRCFRRERWREVGRGTELETQEIEGGNEGRVEGKRD